MNRNLLSFRPVVACSMLIALSLWLTACEIQVSPLGTVPGGTTITISGTATPTDASAPAPTGTAIASVAPAPDDSVPTDVESVMALVNVNIRSGPGLDYAVVSFLAAGQFAAVYGVSEDGDWWSVRCPDATLGCWIVDEPGLTEPTDAPAADPGSGTAATPAPASGTGEATVETLEVRILESVPVQVQAVVQGTLPDACAFIESTEVSQEAVQQENTSFRIRITIAWRANQRCAPMPTPFEEIIPLDVAGLPAGDYDVRINDLVEPFSLRMDNESIPATPGA